MAYKRKEVENMEGLLTNGKKKFEIIILAMKQKNSSLMVLDELLLLD